MGIIFVGSPSVLYFLSTTGWAHYTSHLVTTKLKVLNCFSPSQKILASTSKIGSVFDRCTTPRCSAIRNAWKYYWPTVPLHTLRAGPRMWPTSRHSSTPHNRTTRYVSAVYVKQCIWVLYAICFCFWSIFEYVSSKDFQSHSRKRLLKNIIYNFSKRNMKIRSQNYFRFFNLTINRLIS